MKSKHISQEQKSFYQNLKKSLQNKFTWVAGSTAVTTDLVVLDVRKDIELFKIVTPDNVDNVDIWVKKLKLIHALSWYKANYIIIYVDDDFNELKRESFHLN